MNLLFQLCGDIISKHADWLTKLDPSEKEAAAVTAAIWSIAQIASSEVGYATLPFAAVLLIGQFFKPKLKYLMKYFSLFMNVLALEGFV